jgi:hypothetical protein
MNGASAWGRKEEAYNFRTPTFAIELCMMRRLRSVRVIVDSGDPAEDLFLDVHGTDVSALREAVSKNRRLQEQQRVLKAELDAVRAEQKERKKQFPFKRKDVGIQEDEEIG